MALMCAWIFLCLAACVFGENVLDSGKIDASNLYNSGKVSSENIYENINSGIYNESVKNNTDVKSGNDSTSDVHQRSGKSYQQLLIPVTKNDRDFYHLVSRPAESTKLRRVNDSMDFGHKKTFMDDNMVWSSTGEYPLRSVGEPKSWIWAKFEETFGVLYDLVTEPITDNTDEGRASKKKKKKKILYFLIKVFVGLKVLVMGVLLPFLLTFSTMLSWKAVTLSILAFAFAKLGALKSVLKSEHR